MGRHLNHGRVRWLGFVCATLLMSASACGGGGGDGGVVTPPDSVLPPPPPPAVLSGTVLDESTGSFVAGAVIAVGSLTATSGQNGQFQLENAPVGAALVRVTAAGFDPFTKNILIKSGTNPLVASLIRVNTVYETDGFLFYLPSGISVFRGVFLVLYGSSDTRPMILGDLAFYQDLPIYGNVTGFRQRMMALARAHGLAIMGASFTSSDDNLGTYDRILSALVSISVASGRAALATAPLLIYGYSREACFGYDMSVLHPDRTIGFIVSKGACTSPYGSPGISVPGYFFVAETDPVVPTSRAIITQQFEQNRAKGAVWSLAIEPGGSHEATADQALLFNWMPDVITRRLPATTTPGTAVTLVPVDAASGWLGNRTSFAIAPDRCYGSDKLKASWLPSEQTARDWQAMVSSRSTTTVIPCVP